MLLILWEKLFIPKYIRKSPKNLQNSPNVYVWDEDRDFWVLAILFCMKSYVAVATRLILLEFIQWKSAQVADIYIL